MASPVKAAKTHHLSRGFSEVAGRGRGHLLSRKPGTQQFALTTQVGGIGWHKGPGPFSAADEIDTAWVASTGLWDWEMTQADYRAYIRDSVPVSYRYEDDATGLFIELTASQPVWVNDEGQSENAASFSQVTPATVDDTLTWANIAPGWSLRVQAQTTRLAKFLDIDTLASMGAPTIGGANERLRLPFTYTKSSGLTIWVDGVQWNEQNNTWAETTGDIEFRNGDTPVYWIKRPTAWDTDGNQAPVTQRVRRTGVNFYVEVDVPWAWLQAAVYPVTIDPTVDVDVAASAADATEQNNNTNFTSTSTVRMSANATDANTYLGGWYWASVAVPAGATIDTSFLELTTHVAPNDSFNFDLRGNDVDSGADFSTDADIYNRWASVSTTASVNFTFSSVGNFTTFGSTVEIKTVVQEIIDRAGWATGQNIVLLGKGVTTAGTITSYTASYDHDTAYAARLYIEYTAASTGRAGPSVRPLVQQRPIRHLRI